MFYSSPPLVRFSILSLIILALLLNSCGMFSSTINVVPKEMHRNECVVLLHGLGRTSNAMIGLQKIISAEGYYTVNLDYPSRKKSIEELAKKHLPKAVKQCNGYQAEQIHFVTHSMGGIVVRAALKNEKPENLGRVVMLSPPNAGSEAADILHRRWYYRWINGPAGQELTTGKDSIPNRLGPADYPLGIIMGDKQTFFDSWLASLFSGPRKKVFSGPNDGKLTVERAKLKGMTDFLVVHESHTFIMNSHEVQTQAVEFLKHGQFLQGDER